MKTFVVTIIDEMFGEMKGEFSAETPEAAIADAKEYYAEANDTVPEAIKIDSVIEIKNS